MTLGKLMTVEFGLIQYLDLDNAYMKFHVKQNIRIIMLQVLISTLHGASGNVVQIPQLTKHSWN